MKKGLPLQIGMHGSKGALLLALAALCAGALGGCASAAVKGTVETDIVSHYSENTGKIIAAPVEPGQSVKQGDVLAVIDTRQDLFELEQLEAALALKRAALDEVLAGAENEELRQLENNVRLAREARQTASALADKAQRDLADGQTLYEGGALNRAALDDLTLRDQTAASAVTSAEIEADSAEQRLQAAIKGASQHRIDAALADVTLAESRVAQCRDRLARATIAALTDGTLIGKYYLVGDIVAPGSNLADVAREEGKYVAAYWPADRLRELSLGQALDISAGDAHCTGSLFFMDVSAEYAPKDERTAANRNKTVVRIKLRLDADAPFRPGETVQVDFPEN
ncbi:MAG: biotin/lipoyl-binding protein [Gracilibacteraceae bacterium]|jgi:multidrug resistance efflux pump|nr:biotin/lipoyl-binding protein [Gracilibacteraceae bacterium]